MVQPDDWETLYRLGAAVACGGIIGLERDWRRMPTGLRTLALVCLGSCVAVVAAIKAGDSDGFSRVAQGIITGIGFLGGGVILQKGDLQDVKGLTTAAAIWFTAAIGLLCGLGELKFAFIATGMAVIVLLADTVIDPLIAKRRGAHDRKPPDP
jgi:putative Mg2+ transporter-C (MgtC) family protein